MTTNHAWPEYSIRCPRCGRYSAGPGCRCDPPTVEEQADELADRRIVNDAPAASRCRRCGETFDRSVEDLLADPVVIGWSVERVNIVLPSGAAVQMTLHRRGFGQEAHLCGPVENLSFVEIRGGCPCERAGRWMPGCLTHPHPPVDGGPAPRQLPPGREIIIDEEG